jgi:phospholipid transport system substrate-binding protein
MKAKQYVVFGLFAVLLGLMAVTDLMAGELMLPQKVIQSVSTQLQERLKDKSFTRDFAQVSRYKKIGHVDCQLYSRPRL